MNYGLQLTGLAAARQPADEQEDRDDPDPDADGDKERRRAEGVTESGYKDASRAMDKIFEQFGFEDVIFNTLRHNYASRLA